MVKKVDTAMVHLWGDLVGAVSWLDDRQLGIFEYDPEFLKKGLDISPIHMGLEDARQGNAKFLFSALDKNTYLGLPGLLADALPDKFGNRLIDAWLARNDRGGTRFSPVERLCYTGKRGMGALEFSPTMIKKYDMPVPVEVSELTRLAQEMMTEHRVIDVALDESEKDNADAILDILRVGTSAGGARPKAVIAINQQGNVVSGQAQVPKGYDYWILKFDGVTELELGKSNGFGRVEYAYYLMAKAAGINMTECRLLEENGRAHFMTKRFDRINGEKLHMHSLCGVGHFDFNQAGGYSYEQAFTVMRKLYLSKADAAEQYRRMLFNVLARNLDDHTKNIAFLMRPDGQWQLSPAYDMIYSHNPIGEWTNQHQMTVNGKRDNVTREDLIKIGESISLSKPDVILAEVVAAVEKWPVFARQTGVEKVMTKEIENAIYKAVEGAS